MTDSKTPPPLDDDAATIAETVAPSSHDVAPIQVTRELVNEFLGKTATQDRIREVVAARVAKGTPKTDIDDIVQQANGRALNTEALPHSVVGMRPWVSTVAANAVVDHYRVKKKEAKVMRRSVALDDLPPDEAVALLEDAAAADGATSAETSEDLGEVRLTRWLESSVKTKADRMTFEMIRRKAATKAENARVAAEFGMTEAAYDNRLLRFKAKWVPAWKREKARRLRIALLVVGIILLLVATAIAWIVRPRAGVLAPPRVAPPVVPVPSATASDAPPRFEPALPPERPRDEPDNGRKIVPGR